MSSVYHPSYYGPSTLTDGNLQTKCLSQSRVNSWASVRLPSGMAVGYVAIHNRADAYAYMLGSFEVWLGTTYGDLTEKCGGPTPSQSVAGPTMMWCRGVSHLPYVTMRQVGSARYLTIAEIAVYYV